MASRKKASATGDEDPFHRVYSAWDGPLIWGRIWPAEKGDVPNSRNYEWHQESVSQVQEVQIVWFV